MRRQHFVLALLLLAALGTTHELQAALAFGGSFGTHYLRQGDSVGESTLTRSDNVNIQLGSPVWRSWLGTWGGGLHFGEVTSSDAPDTKVVSGNVGLNMFPSSYFPFQLNYSVSDSRIDTALDEIVNEGSRTTDLSVSQRLALPRSINRYLLRFDRDQRDALSGVSGETKDMLSLTIDTRIEGHTLSSFFEAEDTKNYGDSEHYNEGRLQLGVDHGYRHSEYLNFHESLRIYDQALNLFRGGKSGAVNGEGLELLSSMNWDIPDSALFIDSHLSLDLMNGGGNGTDIITESVDVDEGKRRTFEWLWGAVWRPEALPLIADLSLGLHDEKGTENPPFDDASRWLDINLVLSYIILNSDDWTTGVGLTVVDRLPDSNPRTTWNLDLNYHPLQDTDGWRVGMMQYRYAIAGNVTNSQGGGSEGQTASQTTVVITANHSLAQANDIWLSDTTALVMSVDQNVSQGHTIGANTTTALTSNASSGLEYEAGGDKGKISIALSDTYIQNNILGADPFVTNVQSIIIDGNYQSLLSSSRSVMINIENVISRTEDRQSQSFDLDATYANQHFAGVFGLRLHSSLVYNSPAFLEADEFTIAWSNVLNYRIGLLNTGASTHVQEQKGGGRVWSLQFKVDRYF